MHFSLYMRAFDECSVTHPCTNSHINDAGDMDENQRLKDSPYPTPSALLPGCISQPQFDKTANTCAARPEGSQPVESEQRYRIVQQIANRAEY